MTTSTFLINGEPSDGLVPVTDSSVLRGDGCFEVIRAYGANPFRLQDHLDRLAASAAMLDLVLPPVDEIAAWVVRSAEEMPDSAVRVVVTRGSTVPGVAGEPMVIVFAHASGASDLPTRLYPILAPWHGAGTPWQLAGAKTISYGPNLASSRGAQKEGFDDALLIAADGVILEGPTFSVAWVVDDVVETPGIDLGILDSITRRVVFELADDLGIPLVETRSPLDRLGDASEALAFSTIREVQAVTAIGDVEFTPGPVTARLARAFAELTAV